MGWVWIGICEWSGVGCVGGRVRRVRRVTEEGRKEDLFGGGRKGVVLVIR